jgi:hypothetical protein
MMEMSESPPFLKGDRGGFLKWSVKKENLFYFVGAICESHIFKQDMVQTFRIIQNLKVQ